MFVAFGSDILLCLHIDNSIVLLVNYWRNVVILYRDCIIEFVFINGLFVLFVRSLKVVHKSYLRFSYNGLKYYTSIHSQSIHFKPLDTYVVLPCDIQSVLKHIVHQKLIWMSSVRPQQSGFVTSLVSGTSYFSLKAETRVRLKNCPTIKYYLEDVKRHFIV